MSKEDYITHFGTMVRGSKDQSQGRGQTEIQQSVLGQMSSGKIVVLAESFVVALVTQHTCKILSFTTS